MKLYKEKIINIDSKDIPKEWLRSKVNFKILKPFKAPLILRGLLKYIIFERTSEPKAWTKTPEIKRIIKEYDLYDSRIPCIFSSIDRGYIWKLKMFKISSDYSFKTNYLTEKFDFRFYHYKILKYRILEKIFRIRYRKQLLINKGNK